MKKIIVTGFGLLLAIVVASPNCWAQIKFDNGGGDSKFLTAANWNPDGVPDNTLGNQYAINDGNVVAYDTAVSTSVRSLFVGGDAPQMDGDFGTPGTLNISAGKLTVTGGGDSFQIGRACCNDLPTDVSVINMTGAAILEINGSDPIVGTRDRGELHVGPSASVVSIRTGSEPDTTVYWRLGNYGHNEDVKPATPTGLAGNGLLDVEGSFKAHVIFIGDNSASGELRVRGNGSVLLTGNLVPRPSGFQALGSAKIQMNGAAATLSAYNLESESLPGEVPTKYEFNADSLLGVSKIKLVDAINITNNDLTVNLNGFPVAPGGTVLLFDGDHTGALDTPVGNRVFGTFANLIVSGGVANPASNYYVVYDQPNGNILLARTIPEPSTLFLFGLGAIIAFGAVRRRSR